MSNKIYLGSTNLGTGKIRLGANDVSAIYLGSSLVYGGTQPTPVNPTLVDYVHTSTASLTANYINTGIYPTTDTVFRAVFKPNTTIGNCIVGYDFNGAPGSQASTPTRASSDNTDYRLLSYLSQYEFSFDFNDSRINNQVTSDANDYVDITCGNNYITDNIAQTTQTGTTQSSMATQNVPIYLNVSSDLDFRSLEIWQNNVKVYDGHAAELNGTYGVYDSIGGTFTTQTYGGNSMSGGYIQRDYLCFTATTAPASFTLDNSGNTINPVIYYSTDNGTNWTQWDYSTITLQNVGDKVYFYGDNPNGFSVGNGAYAKFSTNGNRTGRIAASGDIMSLIHYSCPTTVPNAGCFYKLFKQFTELTTAPSIGATTLTQSCFAQMFSGCSNLTTAPQLNATTVPTHAYQQMFEACSGLLQAPALPATTLGNYAYSMMFWQCTQITTAPDLMTQTLPEGAYNNMFNGCSSLNSVKCLATDISASMCTNNWLLNVSATGTFTKDSSMSSWTTGGSGIPSGWTVEDEYDCSDCNNYAECGYESYEECRCQQYGDCPADPCQECYDACEGDPDCEADCDANECEPDPCEDCSNWEECSYESYEDCDCSQYGNCPEEEEPEEEEPEP